MAPGLDPTWRRVAVFRALQLGDLLCAVPAWRALRRALPEAEIVLVGLPWAAAFVERFSRYFDGFRAFLGYPGLPEQVPRLAEWPRFVEAMHAARFDLVLQMHRSGRISNSVAAHLGGRALAGSYQPGDDCPDPGRFLAYPDELPEVRRHWRGRGWWCATTRAPRPWPRRSGRRVSCCTTRRRSGLAGRRRIRSDSEPWWERSSPRPWQRRAGRCSRGERTHACRPVPPDPPLRQQTGLVIGDVILDSYLEGTARHVVPAAPPTPR
jgi:hypothetical protein